MIKIEIETSWPKKLRFELCLLIFMCKFSMITIISFIRKKKSITKNTTNICKVLILKKRDDLFVKF